MIHIIRDKNGENIIETDKISFISRYYECEHHFYLIVEGVVQTFFFNTEAEAKNEMKKISDRLFPTVDRDNKYITKCFSCYIKKEDKSFTTKETLKLVTGINDFIRLHGDKYKVNDLSINIFDSIQRYLNSSSYQNFTNVVDYLDNTEELNIVITLKKF